MSGVKKQAPPASDLSTPQPGHAEHFYRPRIHALLTEAVKKALVLVRAGMGYGKTVAVSDFVRESGIPTVWIQLSDFDNVGLSFWENAIRAIKQVHEPFAEECQELGFPDTEDKLKQLFLIRDRVMANTRCIWVLDDMHLVNNPTVLNVLENSLYKIPKNHTYIVICRDLPDINLSGFLVRGMQANIGENDLLFTENEISQYLLQQGLFTELPNLPEIFLDTKGWSFTVNFLVRVLKKTPGYTKYARLFIKQNLFQLMEKEIWNTLSERLQHFLTRLSLLNRLAIGCVAMLAEGDESLLEEFNQQRITYIRLDDYGSCYLIHHLFLDYLRSKQEILNTAEINDTYKAAADWSANNGFTIDTLTYYEQIGDYTSIALILRGTPKQLVLSIIPHIKGIFDRAPAETFYQVEFFAAGYVAVLLLAGLWRDAIKFLQHFEHKLLLEPVSDEFKRRTMGVLYYLWGTLRQLMCTVDDTYDFDVYFEKINNYPMPPSHKGRLLCLYPFGPWINRAGLNRQGAPQEYCEALARSIGHFSVKTNSRMGGVDGLCRGELLFYQGEINVAKPLIENAQGDTKEERQFAFMHLALFYAMRIAAWQGNYSRMEQVLRDMEMTLEENAYDSRFFSYDIMLGVYYSILRLPESIPDWLKGKFSSYSHSNFLENFGNLIKIRYHYLTQKYDALLAYFEERKKWEIILYGRIGMLAMEACVRYQMKDKEEAYALLREAYETASPNNILVPFVELGKDMRTLTLAALRETDFPVPPVWLKSINQKASVYARQQTRVISEYKKANNIQIGINLTPRERNVLHDLYEGFSRSEIAANQDLSINTVRLVVNRIYEKLQARNLADLIRIVHEQKLL